MPAIAADPTSLYRRQARRLRRELRDEPVKLHRSLQALSQWHDLSSGASNRVWKHETKTDHVKDLIAAVVTNMEGPILRYPARRALLKQAQRAGMNPFDANLIISATQHRLGERIIRTPAPDRRWVRHLAAAAILQAWIVAGLYWLIVR
jgi:hypothetical protein